MHSHTMKNCYHILIHTFGNYPVWDVRGDWLFLKDLYSQLQENGIRMTPNKELPHSYKGSSMSKTLITFNTDQCKFLEEQIQQLTAVDGDRVCGGLALRHLRVANCYIELVAYGEGELLKQQLARLKSRLATLLSFEYPSVFHGKHTWGKGIWMAKMEGDLSSAIEIIKIATSN